MVDTGVFLRWFVDQDGFEHARELQRKLINGSAAVETVDFARVEVAGVLRKKGLLAGRLTAEEFTAAVRVIDDLGVVAHETTADRLERAAYLSAQKNFGMYDALFIQLAAELDMPLLTTDVRLQRAAEGFAPIELLQGIQKRNLARIDPQRARCGPDRGASW